MKIPDDYRRRYSIALAWKLLAMLFLAYGTAIWVVTPDVIHILNGGEPDLGRIMQRAITGSVVGGVVVSVTWWVTLWRMFGKDVLDWWRER